MTSKMEMGMQESDEKNTFVWVWIQLNELNAYMMQHIKRRGFAAEGFLIYIWKHSENNKENN